MSLTTPLQYKISDWHQLTKCLSNNSRELKISVTDFFNNTVLTGMRISVKHKTMGTLFSCILNAEGSLITPGYEHEEAQLSVVTILEQLKKFGFYIVYEAESHIKEDQLEYLRTLDKLGYDKIRIMNVWHTDAIGSMVSDNKIVAFQVDPLGNWLNNAYSCGVSEFTKALDAGTAINLTEISTTKDYNWDWLQGYVLSIKDILADNEHDSE